MRSDRMATWTSGEPVSLAFVALLSMTSFLRSAVIVIFLFRSSKVENTERSELAGRKLCQCNWLTLACGEIDREPLKIVAVCFIRQPCEVWCTNQNRIAATQANRVLPSNSQCRDAVQRG